MRTVLLATLIVSLAATSAAAELQLPKPSPLARVMQTVGVTEVTVEYSSPGMKGRKLWGKLVPFDELWRTGANAATKITFSHDVKVADQAVPAGTYALFTIPAKKKWTVILNKNANQGGTRKYDEGLDQVRFEAKLASAKKRERMTFVFSDTTDASTSLDLIWGKKKLSIPITVDSGTLATANIAAVQKSTMWELAGSARYLLETKGDLALALKLADASIAVQEHFYNVFVKAQILREQGDNEGALALGRKAQELGSKSEHFFWKGKIETALTEWAK
jgi:hypothetical protein